MNTNLFHGDILPLGISHHSPLIFKSNEGHIRTPFRYFNYWAKLPGFARLIQEAWAAGVRGTPLYRVVTKIKRVKEKIIEWKKTQILLPTKLQDTRKQLKDIQRRLVVDPGNVHLQADERSTKGYLDSLDMAEESMYKQRSRDLAVNLGDGNTKYLYRLMRKRQTQPFISQITDMEGTTFSDPSGAAAVFVSYFSSILGPTIEVRKPDHLMFNLMATSLKWMLIL